MKLLSITFVIPVRGSAFGSTAAAVGLAVRRLYGVDSQPADLPSGPREASAVVAAAARMDG